MKTFYNWSIFNQADEECGGQNLLSGIWHVILIFLLYSPNQTQMRITTLSFRPTLPITITNQFIIARHSLPILTDPWIKTPTELLPKEEKSGKWVDGTGLFGFISKCTNKRHRGSSHKITEKPKLWRCQFCLWLNFLIERYRPLKLWHEDKILWSSETAVHLLIPWWKKKALGGMGGKGGC